jgi:hypothetical protein
VPLSVERAPRPRAPASQPPAGVRSPSTATGRRGGGGRYSRVRVVVLHALWPTQAQPWRRDHTCQPSPQPSDEASAPSSSGMEPERQSEASPPLPPPTGAPCTRCLRHSDPVHAQERLTAAAHAAAHAVAAARGGREVEVGEHLAELRPLPLLLHHREPQLLQHPRLGPHGSAGQGVDVAACAAAAAAADTPPPPARQRQSQTWLRPGHPPKCLRFPAGAERRRRSHRSIASLDRIACTRVHHALVAVAAC